MTDPRDIVIPNSHTKRCLVAKAADAIAREQDGSWMTDHVCEMLLTDSLLSPPELVAPDDKGAASPIDSAPGQPQAGSGRRVTARQGGPVCENDAPGEAAMPERKVNPCDC